MHKKTPTSENIIFGDESMTSRYHSKFVPASRQEPHRVRVKFLLRKLPGKTCYLILYHYNGRNRRSLARNPTALIMTAGFILNVFGAQLQDHVQYLQTISSLSSRTLCKCIRYLLFFSQSLHETIKLLIFLPIKLLYIICRMQFFCQLLFNGRTIQCVIRTFQIYYLP